MALTIQKFVEKRVRKNLKRNLPFLFVIILIDLIPLYAVLEHGWDVIDAVFLFFVETAILAFFSVLRMAKASSNFISRSANAAVESAGAKYQWIDKLRDVEVPGSNVVRGSFKTVFIVVFVLVSIPIAFGELALFRWISSLEYFDWNATKHTVAGVSIFWWVLVLLFFEHLFTYWRRYLNDMEYLRTGVLNEGVAITIRVLFQQVILIIALMLAVSETLSRYAAIALFSTKLILDIGAFIVNRWRNRPKAEEPEEGDL